MLCTPPPAYTPTATPLCRPYFVHDTSSWQFGATVDKGNKRSILGIRHSSLHKTRKKQRYWLEQHSPFLYEGYDRYVSYWNGKLIERTEDARRWQPTAGK